MFSSIVKYSRRFAAVVCFVTMLGMSVSAAPSLFEELAERIEGSPFQIFSILSESLREGVSAAEADWVNWRNDEENFALRFYSNMNEHDYALIFEMVDHWEAVDFNLFLNTERIAVSSSYFGEDALGLHFATFADDLPVFFERLTAHGITPDSPDLLEEILGYVDLIQAFLASDFTSEVAPLEFLDLLLPLILQLEQSSEEVVVNAGGTNVNANRLAFAIDMHVFFDTVFEVLYVTTGERMFNELRRAMQENMISGRGTVTFAAYMAETGRLLQVSFEISIIETRNWRGEEVTEHSALSMVANFGAHATDTWLFTFLIENDWRSYTATLAWEISEPDDDSIEHRLVVSVLDVDLENQPAPQLEHVATVGMLWKRTSGELIFFYEDEYGREDTIGIITSMLTMDGNSFNLQIADMDSSFNFQAYATVGAPVPSVDFINLDGWAEFDFVRYLVEDIISNLAAPVVEFDDLWWDAFDLYWDLNWHLYQDLDYFYIDWDRIADFAILTPVAQLPASSRLTIPIPPMPVTLTPPVAWQADPAITIEGPIPAQNTAVAIRDINLRRGPGVSYEAFNHVLAGDAVAVLEVRGSWVKVETDRGIGWVFGRYLDK